MGMGKIKEPDVDFRLGGPLQDRGLQGGLAGGAAGIDA